MQEETRLIAFAVCTVHRLLRLNTAVSAIDRGRLAPYTAAHGDLWHMRRPCVSRATLRSVVFVCCVSAARRADAVLIGR
jgi:hypothetical protein